jgi:cysteine desulfurase/selenocysteine lyase
MALLRLATDMLNDIKQVHIIGTAPEKSAVVSFVVDGVNAMDIGMYLDTLGIAVRTGHHCTEPVMHRFNIPGTVRASFMFYNTFEEVAQLGEGLQKAIKLLKAS